jgi:hypothetical protein
MLTVRVRTEPPEAAVETSCRGIAEGRVVVRFRSGLGDRQWTGPSDPGTRLIRCIWVRIDRGGPSGRHPDRSPRVLRSLRLLSG